MRIEKLEEERRQSEREWKGKGLPINKQGGERNVNVEGKLREKDVMEYYWEGRGSHILEVSG